MHAVGFTLYAVREELRLTVQKLTGYAGLAGVQAELVLVFQL
jgi:hypothetical protein